MIGKWGRRIPRKKALEPFVGYPLFDGGSIRDMQLRTSQWTVDKKSDGTGAFGRHFVAADALPEGCMDLWLVTRLDGQTVQDTSIRDLIFDVDAPRFAVKRRLRAGAGLHHRHGNAAPCRHRAQPTVLHEGVRRVRGRDGGVRRTSQSGRRRTGRLSMSSVNGEISAAVAEDGIARRLALLRWMFSVLSFVVLFVAWGFEVRLFGSSSYILLLLGLALSELFDRRNRVTIDTWCTSLEIIAGSALSSTRSSRSSCHPACSADAETASGRIDMRCLGRARETHYHG